MPTIGMNINISSLEEATAAGDRNQIIDIGRHLLEQGAPAAELLGRIGLVAAHGDSDGHSILTLNSAGAMSRWLTILTKMQGEDPSNHVRELPLLVQALVAAAPAVRAGVNTQIAYAEPFFPSQLGEGHTVDEAMHEAIYSNDEKMVERLLFGLYGTGADYRTIEVRTYDGISTTFQHAGHPLMSAVRGYQLLDAVEWGHNAPPILHWLAPHLPLHTEEPEWVNPVRAFLADPSHSLAGLRTRLAAPKNENALPLRTLILSKADATQVCQGVYDALVTNGASSRGVGSVIALAATDVMQHVGDGNRETFVQAAHGLLFAAAVRLVYAHVQDIAALPLLFTAAAYINALNAQLGQASNTMPMPAIPMTPSGGGLIASSMLESLSEQLDVQDVNGAYATSRRYLRIGNDPLALFATIALSAAQADAAVDSGHSLQIVQAAGEEFIAWPPTLADTNLDGFLHIALRAAAFAKRNDLVTDL